MEKAPTLQISTPYKDWWIRDHADARAVLEDVLNTALNVAEARRSQDDEYAEEDAKCLERLADLALLVQEYLKEDK